MPSTEPIRRFRFTLKQLFLIVALVAVVLAIWNRFFRKEVVVRAAGPEDRVLFDGYINDVDNADLNHKRNVAVATGRLLKGTWLLFSLHIVQAGIVERANEQWVGRDEAWTEGPIWETMTCGMSLSELSFFGGITTDLNITCEAEDVINLPNKAQGVKHNIAVVAKKTLPNTITPGRPHIVYVEGDQAILVDGSMSVEEFARANPGNYLVVTVELK